MANNVEDLYNTLINLSTFSGLTVDVYGDTPTAETNIFGDVEVLIIYKPYDFDGIHADNRTHLLASTYKVEVVCKFSDVDWIPAFIDEVTDTRKICSFDNTFPAFGQKHYIFNINYLGGK